MQALFPSPLYFFDEVDCALDSLAAGRVAAYVKAQCGGSSSTSKPYTAAGTASGAAATGAAACAGNAADVDGANAGDEAEALAQTGKDCAQKAGDGSCVAPAANPGGPLLAGPGKAAGSGGVCGAQYLLVSHRPVVFESVSCLLGVYSNGRGSSAAVVAHF